MRPARLELGAGMVVHATSRIVAGTPPLDDVDRWVMQSLLYRVAGFCGMEVLAYAVLRDRFHVLTRVANPGEVPDDRELVRRLSLLDAPRGAHGEAYLGSSSRRVVELAEVLADGGEAAERARRRLRARMGAMPPFLKELKQAFSIAYNRRVGRLGTLWSDRYSATILEDETSVLRAVTAYVDLRALAAYGNQPLLPGIPPDFTFTSLGEALGGGIERRRYLEALFPGATGAESGLEAYRRFLVEGAPPTMLRSCFAFEGAQACGSPDFISRLVTNHRRLFGGSRSGKGRGATLPWTSRDAEIWPHFPATLEVLGYRRFKARRDAR